MGFGKSAKWCNACQPGRVLGVLFLALCFACPGYAQDDSLNGSAQQDLDTIVVEGRQTDLIGIAQAASGGATGQEQLQNRPILRPAEVLETVPGLIATQHSGSGKANQYFLRGFNLDHGTDFSTSVDGVPINLPTHAHGQGYLDMNFLIPEVIDLVEYKKGPYYSEVGDFSSAGTADIKLVNRLDRNIAKVGVGANNFFRGLLAGSPEVGDGVLLYALEAQHYDGPWVVPENADKYNGVLKYSAGTNQRGVSLALMGYYQNWTATDQIAQRAVDSGQISRFGTLEPFDGGKTERYTLNGSWWNTGADDSRTQANVFASYYALNLFSNFTYFLDNPARGDQFEQADRRGIFGGNVSHQWFNSLFGKNVSNTVGAQVRHDEIFQVGLFNTDDRARFNTVRDDEVSQSSVGLFVDNEIQWNQVVRTIVGLRGDLFYFDVNTDTRVNSGDDADTILSPKASLILGPWHKTEYYLNLGLGYHSNDARGTTIRVDPSSGASVDRVDPLVRSKGAEIGIRTTAMRGLNSTLALWYLELDSELVFVGDAGGTEPSGATQRYGVEWTNYYRVTNWLTFDLDLALTEAKFKDEPGNANEIPNSIDTVIATGATFILAPNLSTTVRLRHSGGRPLIEDGSVESSPTTIVNLGLDYDVLPNLNLRLDVLNALDAEDSDIAYFFESQLQGEAAPVSDVHFHPIESRTFRLYTTWNF